MHAFNRIVQSFCDRNGLRLLVASVYGVMVWRFYSTGQDLTVFMGMFRPSNDPSIPVLAYNMYSLAFMAGGLALPLDQPLEYLASPDCFVYIRRPRTIAHMCRYLAIVMVYCLVFTALQLAMAVTIVSFVDPWVLVGGALCACCTLLVMFLIVTGGYLSGNRAIGYLLAAAAYAALLSTPAVMRWFAFGMTGPVSNWVIGLAAVGGVVLVFDLCRFLCLEII